MSERKVENSGFVITIEVAGVWFFVPRERAIVGERGIPGYILGEDGCLVAFDESALVGLDPRELSIGDWVEYEELDWREGRRASRIKPLIQRAEE